MLDLGLLSKLLIKMLGCKNKSGQNYFLLEGNKFRGDNLAQVMSWVKNKVYGGPVLPPESLEAAPIAFILGDEVEN